MKSDTSGAGDRPNSTGAAGLPLRNGTGGGKKGGSSLAHQRWKIFRAVVTEGHGVVKLPFEHAREKAERY